MGRHMKERGEFKEIRQHYHLGKQSPLDFIVPQPDYGWL